MRISRRAFLAAAALSPLGVTAFAAPAKLPTRALGSTGVQVPLLAFCCGTRFLAYKDEEEVALGVLSRAIDLGFTYLDTADKGHTTRLPAVFNARVAIPGHLAYPGSEKGRRSP